MIFTKLGAGEGVPGPYPHAKLHRCGFKNVGLQTPNSPKFVIFGINLPVWGKFIPKSRKMAIFGINLSQRENFGGHRNS